MRNGRDVDPQPSRPPTVHPDGQVDEEPPAAGVGQYALAAGVGALIASAIVVAALFAVLRGRSASSESRTGFIDAAPMTAIVPQTTPPDVAASASAPTLIPEAVLPNTTADERPTTDRRDVDNLNSTVAEAGAQAPEAQTLGSASARPAARPPEATRPPPAAAAPPSAPKAPGKVGQTLPDNPF